MPDDEASINAAELAAGLGATPGYRYAEIVGDELFVAGQVPRAADGRIIGIGDPAAQTQACLDHLFIVLAVHGFEPDHIRRLVVYVVGEQEHLSSAWQVVARTFDQRVPPATLLGVARLGYRDQLVEIDATVVR